MKILYLITKSEAGGAQTHVAELCKYFKSNGKEVAVLSYPGGWLETEMEQLGVKFFANKYFSNSLNPVRIIKAYLEIKKVIKEFIPDLVHCHSSAAGAYGRLAVRNKIKTLYTAHGWGFNIGVPILQKYIAIGAEKIVSKYCARIICVSEFVKNLGLKYRIAKEDKFVVIYNGIESKVQKFIKSKVDEKIKIIFVGRLAEPKDPLMLIKACQELSDKLKNNLEINIVGDGPKKSELEAFIKQNKIKNVNVLGSLHREQVFDIMFESDIFVLVSRYEGLPITILEAMSVGLPVVASDVGGVGEMINSGINGFLFKDNSAEELKHILERLIKNKNLREKMGQKSKQIIESNFSIDKMLSITEELYKQILNKYL